MLGNKMINFNDLPAKDKIYYQDDATVVYCADNREILMQLSGISAIVTDPPYELGFMGKSWDKTGIAYDLNVWQGCLNALLSGGHLLAFSGTRTYHRMACAIEDAGFEIRDMVEWMYGSGFPKSLDISKAIDKQAGVEREIVKATGGLHKNRNLNDDGWNKIGDDNATMQSNNPISPAGIKWSGWGTALKPAHEPICLARKPLSEKTVASNVLKYGTGGLNIDGCRVEGQPPKVTGRGIKSESWRGMEGRSDIENITIEWNQPSGRFPANLIHDGSDEVVEMFPNSKSSNAVRKNNVGWGTHGILGTGDAVDSFGYEDEGSSARFFYCAKASRSERDEGLEDMPLQQVNKMGSFGNQEEFDCPDGAHRIGDKGSAKLRNTHPTVKPIALMSYLIKLITPPNGIILDPFCGSGSTLVAAKQLGYRAIGIELDEKSCEISKARVMQLEIPKEDVKTENLI